jgi:imidazolonepropionase
VPDERLDGRGGCALPGFVDSHTHLPFAGDRSTEFAKRLSGATYRQIAEAGGGILSTVRATRAASEDELARLSVERLRRMLLHGVTVVEAKSGYGLDFDNELKQLRAIRSAALEVPIEVIATAMPLHEVPPERRSADGSKDKDGWIHEVERDLVPVIVCEGLAEFVDVFCEEGVYTPEETRRHLDFAIALGLKPRLHADELAASGGSELAAELGAFSADHLLRATPAGIAALAEKKVVATILPGTALYLMEGAHAPARALLAAGCAVAIATDLNPGSCPSDNLPLMASLACLQNRMTVAEALVGITLNGAAALDRAKVCGSLEEGKRGDVVILDAPEPSALVARFGSPLVREVVVRGKVAVRDGRIVF